MTTQADPAKAIHDSIRCGTQYILALLEEPQLDYMAIRQHVESLQLQIEAVEAIEKVEDEDES